MIDLYLRAASEAAALSALAPLGFAAATSPAGMRWIRGDERFALDPGVPAEAGAFCLNLRLTDAGASLLPALRATGLVLDPAPATPLRRWA
jgi:hypothetical protein